VKTDLELSHLTVEPGRSGHVDIAVTNNADVIDGITAIIDGINPDWIRLEQPLISLFPEATGRLALTIDIPTTCPAGDYLVIVRIVSTLDADRQTVHDFWLTVTPAPALDITVTPQIVNGGAIARFTATIANTGNTTAEVTVEALEPNREVDCIPDPSNLVIPQGSEAPVEIELRGKRPFFGEPVTRTITVTAHVDDVVAEKLVTFRQRARIPRGVLTMLILASIIVLWALIFLFVITELRRNEDPAKAVGADFLTGPENIPITLVAATLEGTVSASTTGEGVPRVTVEALRVTPDGTLESVGSAASGDDGTFSLQSLIPGTYKVKFSAAGYQTVWFEDGGDAATAEEVRLDPLEVRDDLNVTVTGDLGVLSGKIDVPPDAVGKPLTVTATQVVEQSDGAIGGAPIPPVVTTDGNFTLTGLPTPATYLITVTGDGFQTQQFEQTVSGGQVAVLNTVQLTAANGTISGTVRDGNGQPLGGVAITARSGELVIKSVTPTTGNVGQFQIIGLPTPQTYSITFEFPGYTSRTTALSLAAGQSRTGADVTLFGGSGRVTGVAVDQRGAAVGGATVTVLGDDIQQTTTTLTTGGIGGGPGSFTVTGLPVPGSYTVSISAPGFQTETLSAFFFGGAEQNLGQVVLLPATSVVRGTVTGAGGGGLGEVSILLSDGTPRTRATTSASNPAGSFSFAGIAPGSYTVQFSKPGYVTKVVSVQIQAGVDATVNTSLVAAP
jgi:hypothetical protein